MIKKQSALALALVLALALLLSACGLKDAVQNKTREILSGSVSSAPAAVGAKSEGNENATAAAGTAVASGGSGNAAKSGESGDAAKSDGDGKEVLNGGVSSAPVAVGAKSGGSEIAASGPSSGESGITPSGNRRPIASVNSPGGYYDRLEDEWQNAPEEGYVWTISVDDTATIDVMGLATATYNVRLSCSHVGPDMYGVYSGEFGFDYSADLSGLSALLTATGGTVDYDADGWFLNDRFLVKLEAYEDGREQDFRDTLPKDEEQMSAEDQAIMEAYMGPVLDQIRGEDRDFEKAAPPLALGMDWDVHMTDGDLSAYFQANNIVMGTTTAGSEINAAGDHVDAEAVAVIPLAGVMRERYSEDVSNALPYTIKIYDGGNVVVTFYNTNGSPITVRCYGTIDRIPVEETTVIK
ncbi:MAG: hypothetical protein LBU58_07205 [Clostridiales bacterium]|jgi:hypothetical protein|nr:hypothetical protein [Clostridiales bacterium]